MNPWILIAIAVFFGFGGLFAGKKIERADWQAEKLRQQAEYQATYQRLTDEAREKERQHVEQTALAQKEYQDAITKQRRLYDSENARLRDGSLVLRVPTRGETCGSSASQTGPGASGSVSGATAELSGEIAEAIGRFGSEVDEVVQQLKLCQSIIVKDRQ